MKSSPTLVQTHFQWQGQLLIAILSEMTSELGVQSDKIKTEVYSPCDY